MDEEGVMAVFYMGCLAAGLTALGVTAAISHQDKRHTGGTDTSSDAQTINKVVDANPPSGLLSRTSTSHDILPLTEYGLVPWEQPKAEKTHYEQIRELQR